MRDYQEQLEKQILKLNYKTFTQVVILGSSTFTPFMQMNQNDRRGIIEDILDINIFTIMNNLLKTRMTALKSELHDLDYEIRLSEDRIETYKNTSSLLVIIVDKRLMTSMKVLHLLKQTLTMYKKNVMYC